MVNGEQTRLTEGHEGMIRALSFSAGNELAIGGLSSDVVLWDLGTKKSRRLVKHKKSLRALAFSPRGDILASASDDGAILLWDVSSSEPLGVALPGSNTSITDIAFDSTGDRLAATGAESALMVWDVGTDTLHRRACQIAGRNLEPDEWKRFFRDEPYHLTCGEALLAEANRSATLGQSKTAETAFRAAMSFASTSPDHRLANAICWSGTLNGFAKLVMPTCDRAVAIAPRIEVGLSYDSRGVARAVTGDLAGSIADFEKFIEWTGNRTYFEADGQQRREWIEALRTHKVPFDAATLRRLKSE